jgi:hypothetical protein
MGPLMSQLSYSAGLWLCYRADVKELSDLIAGAASQPEACSD